MPVEPKALLSSQKLLDPLPIVLPGCPVKPSQTRLIHYSSVQSPPRSPHPGCISLFPIHRRFRPLASFKIRVDHKYTVPLARHDYEILRSNISANDAIIAKNIRDGNGFIDMRFQWKSQGANRISERGRLAGKPASEPTQASGNRIYSQGSYGVFNCHFHILQILDHLCADLTRTTSVSLPLHQHRCVAETIMPPARGSSLPAIQG